MTALPLLVASLLSAGEAVQVGVLEEFAFDFGQPLKPQVRLSFVRTAGGWEAAARPDRDLGREPAAPSDAGEAAASRRWTVCGDGASVGTVSTEPLQSEHYDQKGAQRVVSPETMPFTGQRSTEFSGWLNEPVHHPLVATTGTQQQCADPDGWS